MSFDGEGIQLSLSSDWEPPKSPQQRSSHSTKGLQAPRHTSSTPVSSRHYQSTLSLPGILIGLGLQDDVSEQWRPIREFEDCYEVSTNGRVRSLLKDLILKPWSGTDGYMVVALQRDGESTNYRLHRLVAETFLELPDHLDEPVVNHLNCDRTDNRVSNLEWTTPELNRRHASENGLYGTKLSKDQVRDIIKARETGMAMIEISRQLHVPIRSVHYWTKGKGAKKREPQLFS